MHLLYDKFGEQSLMPTALTLRDEHYDQYSLKPCMRVILI